MYFLSIELNNFEFYNVRQRKHSSDNFHKYFCSGPVGVEGLLTTKWILEGTDHTAAEFNEGKRTWIHEKLPVN